MLNWDDAHVDRLLDRNYVKTRAKRAALRRIMRAKWEEEYASVGHVAYMYGPFLCE
jgi:hypothetical protein